MPLVVGRMHAHVYYARASPPFEREGLRSRLPAKDCQAVTPDAACQSQKIRNIRVHTMRPTKRHRRKIVAKTNLQALTNTSSRLSPRESYVPV